MLHPKARITAQVSFPGPESPFGLEGSAEASWVCSQTVHWLQRMNLLVPLWLSALEAYDSARPGGCQAQYLWWHHSTSTLKSNSGANSKVGINRLAQHAT